MISLKNRFQMRNAIKESFDHLPSGVCFFAENGIVVLCNYQMTRLIDAMAGYDLQSYDDLRRILESDKTVKGAIKEGQYFLLADGSAWSFSEKVIHDKEGNPYIEVVASDVTELRNNKWLLLKANEAKRQTVASLEHIQQNIVAITREEEILSLKMKLHNEFGYNLQAIRRYFKEDCPQNKKKAFLEKQKEIIAKMKQELHNEDTEDSFDELKQLASELDMEIIINGDLPHEKKYRELLTYVVRECLINTIRHAQGNQVIIRLNQKEGKMTAKITNNGNKPKKEIKEGGGLTSLRLKVEKSGGTMQIWSEPEYMLMVTFAI